MQLMHTGRISHPDLQPDGQLLVAPSAINPKGQAWTEEDQKDFFTPRELTFPESKDIVEGLVWRPAAPRKGTLMALSCIAPGLTAQTVPFFGRQPSHPRIWRFDPQSRAFHVEVLGVAKTGPGRVGLKLSPEWSRRGYRVVKRAILLVWRSLGEDQPTAPARITQSHVTGSMRLAADLHARGAA
jgi:N-ethylmaleimide reductase